MEPLLCKGGYAPGGLKVVLDGGDVFGNVSLLKTRQFILSEYYPNLLISMVSGPGINYSVGTWLVAIIRL
jgi:hypothetical protein